MTDLDEVPDLIRMKALDLKEIAETFGLWDEVYQKEVIKELEAVHVMKLLILSSCKRNSF